MERFIIQESTKANHWVCTDTDNLIVCVWEAHKFNDTQKFTYLNDERQASPTEIAKHLREMGEWLRSNHYDKVF